MHGSNVLRLKTQFKLTEEGEAQTPPALEFSGGGTLTPALISALRQFWDGGHKRP